MLQRESVPKHTLELLEKLAFPANELGFYLAGGTALALRFGHRVSVDLDFFKFGEFDVSAVINMVGNISTNIQVINQSEYSVAMIVEKTKIEFLRYDYKNLEEIDKLGNFYFCSFIDNAVMKLSAVVGRGTKKDFFDIVEILNHLPLSVLLEKYSEKYPTSDSFIILKSLTWFDDAEADPDPVLMSEMSWMDVKKAISKTLAEL